MKPVYTSQVISFSMARSQILIIDSADIIVLRGKSSLDDTFDFSEDKGVSWQSVDVRESITITSGVPVHVRATSSSMVVEIERRFLSHFIGESGEKISIATVKSNPLTDGVEISADGKNILVESGAIIGQGFGHTRYPGQLVSDLASTTGWTLTTTGGAAIANATMGDGQSCVQFSLAAGSSTAYMDKAGLSIPFNADTTFGLLVEVPDAGRIASVGIAVSLESGAFINWAYGPFGGSGGAVFNSGRYFIPLTVGGLTLGGGTFPAEGTIQTVRLRVLNSYKNQGGVVRFRLLKVNAMARPKLILGFDDGYLSQHTEAFRYMSKYGLLGTVGMVKNFVGTANYMSLAQLKDLYNAGWDIVGHTVGHIAWCSHSVNSICLSQTPAGAGALTLNGSVGTAEFDTPRHVVVRANDQGLRLTITGIDAGGRGISEDLYTWTGGYYLPTQQVFKQVTGVVVDQAATGSIQIGQGRSYAEMQTDLVDVRDYLIANGMPRGAEHFVFAQGEVNATGLALLTSEGFKSARVVSGALQQPHVDDFRRFELPGFGGGGASLTATVLNGYRQAAIDKGGVTSTYLHDITPTASTSMQTARTEFRGFIDATAADVAAGKIDCITQSMVRTS